MEQDNDFAALAADPETAALLAFEPVPRKRNVDGGWTPELQREFIARLALHGSPGRACEEMGKNLTGMMRLYRSPLAASFRAAWDGAVALAKRRKDERAIRAFVSPGSQPPTIDNRRKWRIPEAVPKPGQVLNERGELVDEDSLRSMAEQARDRITNKLLNARRLYLQEISACPGKRAAFEILTELPIDWKKAARLEPQEDEPWRKPSMRAGDMLLTAENGWLGDMAHGPDKKAELRAAVDAWREERGLGPVAWEGEEESEQESEQEDEEEEKRLSRGDAEARRGERGARGNREKRGPRLRSL